MESLARPKSLTELVTEHLRDAIVGGEIGLESRLSEVRIADELNVSRTPVREAVNRLSMEGLVSVVPQKGTFVFSLGPEELAKLCDARVSLEVTALASSMAENRACLIEALKEVTAGMTAARDADDVSAYLALDSAFHQAFFDCADNRFLNDAYQTIAPKMSAMRNRLGRHPDHMDKSYDEHLAMLDAVRDGHDETALDILRRHIDRKEGSYWRDATRIDQN